MNSRDVLSQLLLPYQSRGLADRSRLKIYEKSRRVGISWEDSLESAITAAAPKDQGGMDCYYIGFNKEMAETYIEDCAKWARALNLLAGEVGSQIIRDEDKDILVFRIRFASGHKVMALSSKPNNLRSRKGRIILDEFAFHENQEELFKSAMATLVWGGKVAIISTHNGVGTKFYELCEGARSDENDWSLHRITIDDALAEGLYQRICQVQGVDWSIDREREWRAQLFRDYGSGANQELLCIPDESSNGLFDMQAVEGAAIGKWSAPKKEGKYLICVDPNFGTISNDYYVAQVWDCAKLPFSLVFEFRDNSHGSEYHSDQLEELVDAFDPLMVVFEKNAGGFPMAQRLQRSRPRLRVEVVHTSASSKAINTDRLAQMIEQGDLIFPSDWNGISEMRRFSRLSRMATSGHDDSVMCAAVGLSMATEVIAMADRSRSIEWLRKV